MILVKEKNEPRIRQGDIIKNVEYIENVLEENGVISVSRIVFPLVVVLTQDCDLTWDYDARNKKSTNQDKFLLSVIVAPLYNYEHFLDGVHLQDIGQQMATISRKEEKTDNKNLRQNETPRYHYLDFDSSIPIVNSVIDFKHYFTVNVEQLRVHKQTNFICSVSEIFREHISQRFANYLSRIGLPEPKPNVEKQG